MPNLFNYATKKWETVPDENVTNLLKSGNYVFQADQSIPLVDFQGERYSVPASQVYDKVKYEGAEYQTQDMQQRYMEQRAREQKLAQISSPWSKLGLGALGAASGATLGLSDLAVGAIADDDTLSDIRLLKEAYPEWYTPFEIGGSLLGLGKVGAPVRAAAQIATKAGTTAAKLGGATAAKLGAKSALGKGIGTTTGKLVEGGVDAALYEAGRLTSEYALEDPEFQIENAVSRLGMSSLLGGGFNVGLGALYKAGVQTGNILRKYANQVDSSPIKDAAAKAGAKVFKLTKGLDDDAEDALYRALRDPEEANRMIETVRHPEKLSPVAAESLKNIKSLSDDISYGITRTKKKALATGKLKDLKLTTDQTDEMLKRVNDKYSYLKKQIDDNPDAYGAFGKVLDRQVNRLRKEISEGAVVDEVDNVMTQLRGGETKNRTVADLHQVVKKARDRFTALKGFEGPSTQAIEKIRNEYYSMLRDALNDPKVFGKYGDVYKNINNITSEYLSIYNQLFGKRKGKLGALVREDPTSFATKNIVDENKVESLLYSPVRNKNNRRTWKLIDQLDEATTALVNKSQEEFAKIKGLTDEQKKFLTELSDNLDQIAKQREFIQQLKRTRQGAILLGATESKTGAKLLGPLLATSIGGSIGGAPAAAAAGAIGGVLSSPMTSLKIVASLRQAGQESEKQMNAALRALVGRDKKTGFSRYRTGKAIAVQRLSKSMHQYDAEVPDKDPTMAVIKKLNQLSRNPEMIEEMTRASVPQVPGGQLDELHAAAANTATRAFMFLAEKAPKLNLEQSFYGSKVNLSYSQKATFEKYVDAVMNPGIILEQMKNKALDTITVETVKEVYPSFYGELQKRVMDKMVENPQNFDYTSKAQLGLLLDLPITQALKNISVMQDASAQMQEQMQQESTQRRTSQAPLKGVSNNVTQGQRLASRSQ